MAPSCFQTAIVLQPKYAWITVPFITTKPQALYFLWYNFILSCTCISSKEQHFLESKYNKQDTVSLPLISNGHSLDSIYKTARLLFSYPVSSDWTVWELEGTNKLTSALHVFPWSWAFWMVHMPNIETWGCRDVVGSSEEGLIAHHSQSFQSHHCSSHLGTVSLPA